MSAREVSLIALGEFRRGRDTGTALRLAFAGAGTDDSCTDRSVTYLRDKNLAMRMFNGVLQNMALCDFYAECFSSIALKKLEPRVLDIIRLSIYQIVFLTKVPRSAAVSEGVSLAKKYANTRAAGYVNAVLRKISDAAERSELPQPDGDFEHKLSIKYSHPLWLVHELNESLGPDGAEAYLKAGNEPDTPVTAQVNRLSTDTDKTLAALKTDGIAALRHAFLEDCIEMYGPGEISNLEAFTGGYMYIQDAAARLVVTAADPKPGDFVIDGCAAPGGKSFAAAIVMNDTGRIVALDVNERKLRLINDGAKRLGISIIETFNKDAAVPLHDMATSTPIPGVCEDWSSKADVVLADVPCSGFGVIRKKPDIRYKREKDISGLPEIQFDILTGLSSYVKPGGLLVYSTCTVLKRENDAVVERFLAECCDFSPEDFSLPGIRTSRDGKLRLLPHIHGTDGFFICKLRKCKDDHDE